MARIIPQIEPWIDQAELDELKRVIESTYVTEGPLTADFERMTTDMTGARHAIAVSNGTVALYCCLMALGIQPGDEVIVPDLTFIASANAVIMAGGIPVLVDVTPDTFCIDIKKCGEVLTKRTKFIIPVHLYGQSADMTEVCKFATDHGLRIVEDASQGVGVLFNGKHVGTFGECGVLSYYGNKTITCGEGGIILTDDDDIAVSVRRLKNHGRDKKGIFIHNHIGFNFAFTEMQAAIGISQMRKLPLIIEKKRLINQTYRSALDGLTNLQAVTLDERSSPVFWFTSYLLERIDEFQAHLLSKGIQTRRFFYPLHMQPCYENHPRIRKSLLTNSVLAYKRGISLPSSYSLSQADQRYIVDEIRRFFILESN